MKRLGDVLLSRDAVSEIVIGNSALVRAMVESGTQVVTAYPGSPTPEIATAIQSIPEAVRPFYFEFSTNEKVATEVAFGASINGHLSCVFFKSVGLNVAADSFVQLSHMELIGGLVVVIGDDPGANSSQNEQDNRHFARMTYTPLFEPSSAQQAYAMYKEAAELSRSRRMPVLLRLTTHVCHAKEKVSFAAWNPKPVDRTPRFDSANGPYIPIASLVFPMKQRALRKRDEMAVYSESCPFHMELDHGNPHRGIVTAGLPLLSLRDVMGGISNPPDVLSLGMIYPLPRQRIARFLAAHEEVKVLEELDDFIEQEVKAIAYDAGLRTRIIGKQDNSQWMGEYTPTKVAQVMHSLWPDQFPPPRQVDVTEPSVRPPQLCPGCGHRTAFYAVKKALRDTDITVADIGCHTLGFLEPYQMGQSLLSMGHCSGTAAGLSLFNDSRKVVTFIGDSTLFHAGLPGIVNAVFNRHNFTLVVMENGTTAMTGHQNHPASGHNFDQPVEAVSIEGLLQGLGVKSIRRTDAYAVGNLVKLVQQATAEEGLSVIIATHPCMLKYTRDQRRAGKDQDKMVSIDQATCTLAYTCVSEFACPTFQVDAEGRVHTHPDLCIGDASCLQTCGARAIRPPHPRDPAAGGGAQ
jgi:indolepyruvate ferredoxin oxidoreductase alpha subunit